jgi:hypothetical protein
MKRMTVRALPSAANQIVRLSANRTPNTTADQNTVGNGDGIGGQMLAR